MAELSRGPRPPARFLRSGLAPGAAAVDVQTAERAGRPWEHSCSGGRGANALPAASVARRPSTAGSRTTSGAGTSARRGPSGAGGRSTTGEPDRSPVAGRVPAPFLGFPLFLLGSLELLAHLSQSLSGSGHLLTGPVVPVACLP
ncbi:hypothetical protein GCM10010266_40340 [Streptomyces griseomycini]|nr:hypothetical protein GCM10010266_40340 [Streptomyces griseomycini]